jgi:hypothetical protein
VGIEDDVDGAGGSPLPAHPGDREGTAQQGVLGFHRDLHELARLRSLGDLPGGHRHQPVRPFTAAGDDLTGGVDRALGPALRDPPASSPHAAPPAVSATPSRSSAWYSCRVRTSSGPRWRASMPWTAARMPARVVITGTPLVTAACRIS